MKEMSFKSRVKGQCSTVTNFRTTNDYGGADIRFISISPQPDTDRS